MGFLDRIFGTKKKAKTAMQRTVKEKKARKKYVAAERITEDPLISVGKQLTHIERDVQEIQSTLVSGFRGLREDHHKIIEEQATKTDFDGFKKYLETKKSELEKMREDVDRELEMLDIDKEIVERLGKRKMRAAEIADELKISRQYAAMRLSELVKYGVVEQKRKGREIYYTVKK